jgi:hypothetical protein
MREALDDPELLGGALPGDSWRPWRVLLIAAMGEPLTDAERVLFGEMTGREREPLELVEEVWAVVGRRGGKTRAAGTLAAYVGALCDHSEYLAPGERGALPILAASLSQAMRAFMHAKAILQHSPILRQQIDGEPTSDTIRLKTGIDIEVKPANFRTVRSITAPAAICDEVAFWMIENSANPDTEILNALRPALATTGGPLMVISSPFAKKGELYETHRDHFGPAGDRLILVAQGPSRLFNSTLKQSVVDRAYQRDPEAAKSEYGGEFRDGVTAYISREAVEACVTRGVLERAPVAGVTYRAFVDPSGAASDSMTLAIGHEEGAHAVVDALRERKPPFSPEAVVAEYAALLKTYGVSVVKGDRYGGEWPREAFRRHGIAYHLSDQAKSGLYQDMLPVLNSGRAELLDSPTLVKQIAGLQRLVARGGRESIDHPRLQHDDLANAVAGLIGLCIRRLSPPAVVVGAYSAHAPAHALVGSFRRGTGPGPAEELPPPEWVLNPKSEAQAAQAQAYLRRRAMN